MKVVGAGTKFDLFTTIVRRELGSASWPVLT